ncbi:MAG: pectinesterase family protein [Lachnospirales bacterium]
MKFKSKRVLSSIIAFAMTISSMVFAPVATSASSNKVDVWDFGGVAMSDTTLYENHIDTSFIDSLTFIGDAASGAKGKFTSAGDFDFNGLNVNSIANDRYYYNGDSGLRSYGTNGKASNAYSDGYVADGMWYANGTGGDSRRFMSLPLNAGDLVAVYTGPSNTTDLPVHFTSGSGTDIVKTVSGGSMDRLEFIATTSDTYKIWFDAAGGKPVVNRIMRYPAVTVTGNIDLQGNDISNYTVSFKNEATGDIVDATLDGTTYSANLTPNYKFTAILSGATGYGFTNKTKTVEVSLNDILTGKTSDLAVETKSVYKVSGSISGFDSSYNLDNLAVSLIPDAESMADTVVADLDKANLTYSATLEPDIDYTVNLSGVNDYEVTANGIVNNNVDCTNDVTVSLKPMYTVTGKFVGYGAESMTVKNMEDGYTYTATVEGEGYTINLRNGNYEVSVEAHGGTTSSHIAVNGKNTTKDILVIYNGIIPETVFTNDVYVGCPDKDFNYNTMTEALDAINNGVISVAGNVNEDGSINDRLTVHIAPGVYREQISLSKHNVTFVKEGEGEVKLTWYYGIGYEYYSIDSTGYYNYENDFDKFERNQAQKWGTAFYLKEGATGFKAEGITFENSFNQYITDEEIADGVKSTVNTLPERTYATDVRSKAATERATAISIESDNTEFKDCTFIGSQDTLYIGGKVTNHVYFKNCLVQGNTDYIFGSGNAVFDGCELRFGGYTDNATGGYITAGRSNGYDGYLGYLFRACSITNASDTLSSSGYFGRPWDPNADITFLNCTVPSSSTITSAGWTEMSGVKPEQAKFKEFGTTLTDGTAVDVSGRVSGTVLADSTSIVATDYFGGWTPTYYSEDTLPIEFTQAPYLSTGGDVLLPQTGDTFTVKYSLGDNDKNDVSIITYSLVAEDGTETVVKSETASSKTGLLLTKDMIGSKLKITVTPKTIFGNMGSAVSVITEKEITLGSGSVDTDRPSGKAVVFLAGDSTVKDYSAGAINNSGANRPEGSWGEFIGYFLDDNYEVMNYAQGGRSSRTFINGTSSGNDKYLDKIKEQMMAGDYLFIQFGHNDSSESYADRYVPVGTPDNDGKFPYTPQTGTADNESGSFCWYLQQYVDAAKAVGATPVLVTPVARMYFNSDGTIRPHHGPNDEYVTATKQVAEDNGIECIDLYAYTKGLYEDCYKLDGVGDSSETAYRLFASGEKTHHSKLGGYLIASYLADYIKYTSNNSLSSHITVNKPLYITDDKGNEEFSLSNSYVFTATGRNENGVFDSSVAAPEYIVDMVSKLIDDILNGTTPVEEIKIGDADGNGEVTSNDVTMVMQNVLSGTEITRADLADVNKDGNIDTTDVAMILQHVLDSAFSLD